MRNDKLGSKGININILFTNEMNDFDNNLYNNNKIFKQDFRFQDL